MTEAEKKEILKEVKKYIKDGLHEKALKVLGGLSEPSDDFVMQSRYAALFKSIPEDALRLKKLRIAILPTSTTSHLGDVLKYWLAREGFAADIYEAGYDVVHQTALDPKSPLYEFKPDITLIFTNYRDVKCEVRPGSSAGEIQKALAGSVRDFTSLWDAIQKNSNSYIIQNNADTPYHRVFGNYEAAAPWGHLNMLRAFNLELAKAVPPGVTIFDLDHAASAYGKKRWCDMRYWYHSKHAFAPDATGPVAYDLAKVIGSVKGSAKKCVILDLDNTLWGGVVGDDGLDGIVLGNGPAGEAFVDFQKFLLKLKRRGVMLAVCSKNEEETAKEPFLSHPDMQLKLDDVVIFRANWLDKVSNIKEISSILNIGLDSMVFVDDNPAERELVRQELPMVSVPELPEDPSEYVAALSSHAYFETVSFSEEDIKRSDYYRADVTRGQFQKTYTDLSGYLKGLGMEMAVGGFDDFNLSRIAQLINKSNQFHLTTTRYTESQIKAMFSEKNKYCRYFKLKDRFGDNGLISAVILEKAKDGSLAVDTWVMSCRVLSRGVEEFVCAEIVSLARQSGCKKIKGRYIPTKKNRLVSRLYERLSFKMVKEENGETHWELDLDGELPSYETFIKKTSSEEYAGKKGL